RHARDSLGRRRVLRPGGRQRRQARVRLESARHRASGYHAGRHVRAALAFAIVVDGAAIASASPSTQLDRARKSFKARDWQSTINEANPLVWPKLQLGSQDEAVEAHLLLGAADYELGDPESARREFEEAIKIDPDRVITTNVFSGGAVK